MNLEFLGADDPMPDHLLSAALPFCVTPRLRGELSQLPDYQSILLFR
jgi:hypothetical protein